MQETFQRAVTSGARRIFLLEDKVIFLCEFKAQFWQLLANVRCADHLFTEHQGGVLLLGAQEVTPDGLEHIESDRSQAFAEYDHDVKAALCYNVNSKTKGSFAGVYHRSTFGEILSWLEAVLHRPDIELPPFHDVFSALSDKGYV